MLITELKTIEYLEFVKKIFRDSKYKFLLLFVARYGDNKKVFLELEEYWSSIDNLTADKIVFLNFSSSIIRNIENDENYLKDAYGERIISKEIQPFIIMTFKIYLKISHQQAIIKERLRKMTIYHTIIGGSIIMLCNQSN
jgi:hypothetical protein